MPVGTSPHGVAVAGTMVYVANLGSNTVSIIDTDTKTVVATVNVGKSPYGVAVTPGWNGVYVTNDKDNTVSVIDVDTNKVKATVSVGDLPKAFGQFIGSIPQSKLETNKTEQAEGSSAESQENTGTLKAGNTQATNVNNYYNNNSQTNTKTNIQTTNVNNYYNNESTDNSEHEGVKQADDTSKVQSKASSASVNLHGEKTTVVKGEDILLKLSAVNLITKPTLHVQAIIIPPSGMSVSSAEFVESGAGQYTTTYEIEPGKGRDIEVRIAANQVGDFNVTGRVVYYFGDNKTDGEDYTLDLPIQVDRPKSSTHA